MESTFIILTQIITFGTAWSMFHCIIKKKKRDWLALAGALVYLLLPYHVYVVTQSGDQSQTLIWMLLPILAAALIKLSDTGKSIWDIGYGLTAMLALGIVGRLDGVAGLILFFLICVGGICRRQWQYPVIGILGLALAYPTYMTWKHWLFDGAFAESGLEYVSIMENGYSIGGLFSTYFYRDGNPGMGIWLLLCLLFIIYNSFVKGKKLCTRKDHIWLGTAVLLTAMSLRYFPWDFVQRMGSWALGLVTLIRTPAVFFGYAQILLCVWSIEKCGEVLLLTEKTGRNERDRRNEGFEVCDVEKNRQDVED